LGFVASDERPLPTYVVEGWTCSGLSVTSSASGRWLKVVAGWDGLGSGLRAVSAMYFVKRWARDSIFFGA
jgi:hypothetical protein